jgi:hypothetical protein
MYLEPDKFIPNVHLSEIPLSLQEKYDIGSELDVQLVTDGFYVRFKNRKGKFFSRVEVDMFYLPEIKHTDLRAPSSK